MRLAVVPGGAMSNDEDTGGGGGGGGIGTGGKHIW